MPRKAKSIIGRESSDYKRCKGKKVVSVPKTTLAMFWCPETQ
jgi:hypothetical protein